FAGVRKPKGNKDHGYDDRGIDFAPVAAHVTLGHARDVTFTDVTVRTDTTAPQADRHALYAETVTGLVLDGIAAHPSQADSDRAAIHLESGRDATIRLGRALAGTGTFVRIAEDFSGSLVRFGNDVTKARVGFDVPDELAQTALTGGE
ncbi:MAG: hypothetical protein AAGG50_17800, partial [Bacteroidota bacterium]